MKKHKKPVPVEPLPSSHPPVVLSRATSRERLVIPYENEAQEPEDPEREKAMHEMAARTTPQGREIVRKLVFRARRMLLASSPPGGADTRAKESKTKGPLSANSATVGTGQVAAAPSLQAAIERTQPTAAIIQLSTPTPPKSDTPAPVPAPPAVSAPPPPRENPQVLPRPTTKTQPFPPPGFSFGGWSAEEARRRGWI